MAISAPTIFVLGIGLMAASLLFALHYFTAQPSTTGQRVLRGKLETQGTVLRSQQSAFRIYPRSPRKCPFGVSEHASPTNSLGMDLGAGRLGNIIFQYMSMRGIAAAKGFAAPTVALGRVTKGTDLSAVVGGVLGGGGGGSAHTNDVPWNFDESLQSATAADGPLSLRGYYQSYRYFCNIESEVRAEVKALVDAAVPDADALMDGILVAAAARRGVRVEELRKRPRVGVHVRLGDMSNSQLKYVFWTPDKRYLDFAFGVMEERIREMPAAEQGAGSGRQGKPLFIVVCGGGLHGNEKDRAQCEGMVNRASFDVEFGGAHSAEQDLAMLMRSDHVVMSSGTFGWWGGFVSPGVTVAFKRPCVSQCPCGIGCGINGGKKFKVQFEAEDFFPPDWVLIDTTAGAAGDPGVTSTA
jgi:hypothetical protein